MSEPWTEDQARWVIQRAATLAAAGAEPVGPLVLPTSRFFPDRFDRTPASIGKLFARMTEHVGLSDLSADVVLVDEEAGAVVSSCSSGGCGAPPMKVLAGRRVSPNGDGYTVAISTTEVGHPVVLTTIMARAVGALFLDASGALGRVPGREREAFADLAASMLGLGVLIANGAGIQVKGCGGVKVHAATSLPAPQAALALALVVEREARRGRPAPEGLSAGLDPVARDLFGAARTLVRQNRDLVRRLDDAPAPLERGDFKLRLGHSLTDRLLTKIGVRRGPADPIEMLERELSAGPGKRRAPMDPAKRAQAAELGELYDEAIGR